MKKIFTLSILSLFMLSAVSFARTTYNPDNTINVSSTIRGQKAYRAQQKALRKQRALEAAAAAKINYENDCDLVNKNTKTRKK